MVGDDSLSPEARLQRNRGWSRLLALAALGAVLVCTKPGSAQDAGAPAEQEEGEAEEPAEQDPDQEQEDSPQEEEVEEEPEQPEVEPPAPPIPDPRPPYRPPFSARSPSTQEGDTPRTRVESDDGVIVLSNRNDGSDEGEDNENPAGDEQPGQDPGAAAPVGGNVPPSHGSPGEEHVGDETASLGIAELPIKRSPKRKSKEDDEDGGPGWLWVLFGAAALLLVPIGLLLNRGSRDSGQPVSRYPTMSGPPPSSTGSSPVPSRAPPDEH